MSAAPPAPAAPESAKKPNHARRVIVAWIVLSLIATPLVAIFLGPAIPPGNGSVQASGQTCSTTP